MEKKVLAQVSPVVLPWRVKILYAAGSFSKALLAVAMAAFMLYFYTDVCGIDSTVAATIILIAKIWDIINDPMMGAIIDRTRSKEGKCRFWLKYMSVPGMVIVALCFFVPELTTTGKMIWVAVTYVLQGMISTSLLIPFNTMISRLTSDERQRVQLTQADGIGQMLSQWMVVSLTFTFVGWLGGGDTRKGFLYVGIIYGIIYGIGHLIVYFATKGYEPVEHSAEPAESVKESTGSALKGIISSMGAFYRNKVLMFCGAVAFLYTLGMAVEEGAMAWYFQYVKTDAEALYGIYGTMSMPVAIVIYLFLDKIVKKLGNARTVIAGSCFTLAGYALGFVTHDATKAIMMTRWFLEGIGAGLIGAVILLCVFDSKTYGVWKNNDNDSDAILTASYSLSYKIGMAIGGPILGYVLAFVPYEAGAAVQPENVCNLFFYESTLIPGLIYVATLIFALLMRKYEKRIPQMQKEIEERKQKQNA